MPLAGRVLALAALAALLACSSQAADPAAGLADGQAAAQQQQQQQMPKLFDFAGYKQTFGKQYANLAEDLSRKALFMARAFRTFVAGLAFRFRRSSHFLALNHMSDWTAGERESLKNKRLSLASAGRAFASEARELGEAGEGGVAPEVEQEIEAQIRRVVGGAAAEGQAGDLLSPAPQLSELRRISARRTKRTRRDALAAPANQSATRLPPRKLSLDQLIKSGPTSGAALEPAEVRAKMVRSVPSNNPNYEPIEAPTQGLVDQQETPNRWRVKRQEGKSLLESFKSTLSWFYSGVSRGSSDAKEEEEDEEWHDVPEENDEWQADKMFVDHRASNCMFAPRNQIRCGSCYAFASITYVEWLHCMETGKLVAFSEQYMVDCGNMRVDKDAMVGCDGATMEAVPKFLHNFGVELRANYPYRNRDEQCPYEEDTDLKRVGYIRMNLLDYTEIPLERWEEFLKYSPIFIGIATTGDFSDYGGGVDDGQDCGREGGDHAVLLVGHGREDGQEFWLIRNSYSIGWGDAGYYKLSKSAPSRCIDRKLGYVFGTRDGKAFKVAPRENELNDNSVVRDHYLDTLDDTVNWAR